MPFATPVSTNHADVYPAINPSNPELSQAGKVVVITGGAQGIGAAISRAFVAAGAAHVALLGRTQKTLDATKEALSGAASGSKVHTFVADVTDEERTEAVFAEIHKTLGPIDVVVANAGYLAAGPIKDLAVADFRRNFDINVVGTFITAAAFLRHKTSAPTATFVSMNSGVAHLPAFMPGSGYVASKAAAARLVEALHFENPDVRAFSIHPGVVKTEMAQKAGMYDIATEQPELAAGLTVYLTTPKAEYLRGRFLWSNWDVDELKQEFGERIEKDPSLLTMTLGGWGFDGKTAVSAFD